jgi:hypothetical protein
MKTNTYTLDKLLKMLPYKIAASCAYWFLRLEKEDKQYCIGYDRPAWPPSSWIEFSHKNPAEAANKLLTWCIENGHIKGKKP